MMNVKKIVSTVLFVFCLGSLFAHTVSSNDNKKNHLSKDKIAAIFPDAVGTYSVASDFQPLLRNFGTDKYIEVMRQYRLKAGDLNYIQVKIGDYVEAPNMWVAKPYLWSGPVMPETPAVKFSIIKIGGFNARLKESKTNDYTDIIMGVNDRFLLSIEGNEDAELFIKTLAEIVEKLKETK